MVKKLCYSIILTLFIITGCTSGAEPIINPPSGKTPNNSGNEPTVLDAFLIRKGAAQTENISYKDIESVAVLVNKQNSLPKDYVPSDLVEVNIPFTFNEKHEKRMLRQEAAQHLEDLFAHAKSEGVVLYGVSGYRSYATQKALFAYFTSRYGSEKEANRTSARPGESEHQTGLAMDVTSQSVNFGLAEKFGDTPEYDWLKDHVHEYGYVIRYMKDKEYMTEYMYEPWHLRYVGVDLATKLYKSKLTYEEYLFFKI